MGFQKTMICPKCHAPLERPANFCPNCGVSLQRGGGRILAVGRRRDILTLKSERTEVLELDGALVLPGFTDTHIHFYEWARQRRHRPGASRPLSAGRRGQAGYRP